LSWATLSTKRINIRGRSTATWKSTPFFVLASGGRCGRMSAICACGFKMRPGRAFDLLAGVVLLGAIVSFSEMMPDAQASLLDAAVKIGAPVASPEPPALAGNPLWALPLEQLATTRERPIFSPSRRPAAPPTLTHVAPVAVPLPAKPPAVERPAVSLIGTVIGTNVRLALFFEAATHKVVRLRVGQEHEGWVLSRVKEREVTLVKGAEQTLVFGLPPPGEMTATSSPPVLIPVNTASYVDEQPLPARGMRR